MLSLDTETTGIDLWHGARPFLVTVCHEDGTQRFWQWDVDPLMREPVIPPGDLEDIAGLLVEADSVVAQNGKFDAAGLEQIGLAWPWRKAEDTLVASHVLASNRPHDLTSLALEYLSIDIQPFEDRLKLEVNEARKMVRSARLRVGKGQGSELDEELCRWRIAEEGLPEMPSAKSGSKKDAKGIESESPWKFDCWLPLALAKRLESADDALPEDHPWWRVCAEYANADSAVTLPLWFRLKAELERRGLFAIYREKMRNLPILAEMEREGVTVLSDELRSTRAEYRAEIKADEGVCKGIAESMGCELTLPKSGNNKSLAEFCFGETGLRLPVIKRTEGFKPSLDKEVIEEYKKTLDGHRLAFVKSLSRARKKAKSCDFLDAYEVFGVPGPGEMLVLHPSVNPTATATTRMSMSNPNLQQVSKLESRCETCLGEGCAGCGGSGLDQRSVRLCFGPPPGKEWWTADAENIELRLPAYSSGEPELIELFEKPNEPPHFGSQHLLNFSVVYPDVWAAELKAQESNKSHIKEKFKSTYYQWCKNGDFAIQYQCGEETADRTFRKRGAYRALKQKFVKLEALNQWCLRFAERKGYIETLPDRSVCPDRGYPLLCARDFRNRIKPTLPLNYRIQGTAGWWMVRAMNRCQEELLEWKAAGFHARIVLTVHDELVFEMPASFILKNGEPSNLARARTLAKLMERGGDDVGIPTPVSINWCPKNWAEGKSFKAA